MPKINVFLSYRRDDSELQTRNIADALDNAGYNVFMDRTSIQPGEKWPDKIRNSLRNANLVLAIIGNQWLTCQAADGRRRIDGEEDWVHLELKEALQTNKIIIPVLVYGAKMPSESSLPNDIADLSNRQLITCTRENWDSDIQNLLRSVQAIAPSGIPEDKPTLPKPTLLLASESSRRKELLKQIGWIEGVDYFTINASLADDEDNIQNTTLLEAQKFAEKMARKKIDWVVRYGSSEITKKMGRSWIPSQTILIGVDTIIFCKDKILDTPLPTAIHLAGPEQIETAKKRAKEMLLEQKGEKIYIITGLAVALGNEYSNPISIVTEAELRHYSESDIDNYIYHSQPFNLAGAFGIQEKGVSLFRKIKGSYTNIVGLPLQEFIAFLQEKCINSFKLPELKSSLIMNTLGRNENHLSVVCVGDINYDYVYDKFPADFFTHLHAPGGKIIGKVRRSVGGTAVNFAKGANKAGFAPCSVVGVIGGDALGNEIVKELEDFDITPICPPNPGAKTSIAIIFRDTAQEDTSLTITDARQSLPDSIVETARETIKKSDILYCSGYCLVDRNRRTSALKMLHLAKEAGKLAILDIVVGMNKAFTFAELTNSLQDEKGRNSVDVMVSEMPEIFDWFQLEARGKTELETWDIYKNILISGLRQNFSVSVLRTSKYTHEIIITPDKVFEPVILDYATLEARDKVGYGDFRTAKQVRRFLSPRIVLASKSPQRFNLLSQIIAPSKIEVIVSNCNEENMAYEKPDERVQRLAMNKADAVFIDGKYHDDIELIIGADTEIIRESTKGEWEMIGHPRTTEEAITELIKVNDTSHYAITGIAIIGKDPLTDNIKKVTACVNTKVSFAKLSPEEIKAYAETGEPIGRAGAYAIQGLGTMLIKDLEGSYSNVVGLPLERLSEILAEEFNKPIWKFDKVSNWNFPDPIKGLRP